MNLSAKGQQMMIYGVLIGGLGFAYWLSKRGVSGVASDISSAAVSTAAAIPAGVILGAGDVLGVPHTSQTQCQKDLAAGKTWDASFSCPAGTFIKSFFG